MLAAAGEAVCLFARGRRLQQLRSEGLNVLFKGGRASELRLPASDRADFGVQDVVFRYSQLGDLAGVLGSALICLEKYFEIPALKPPRFLFDADCQVTQPFDVLPERAVSEEFYTTGVL